MLIGRMRYVLNPLATHNRISSVSTGGRVMATPRRKKYVAVDRRRAAGVGVGGLGIAGLKFRRMMIAKTGRTSARHLLSSVRRRVTPYRRPIPRATTATTTR